MSDTEAAVYKSPSNVDKATALRVGDLKECLFETWPHPPSLGRCIVQRAVTFRLTSQHFSPLKCLSNSQNDVNGRTLAVKEQLMFSLKNFD